MFALADGTLVLAATDLTNYLAGAHLTQQRLGVVRGERSKPRPAEDPHAELVRERGRATRMSSLLGSASSAVVTSTSRAWPPRTRARSLRRPLPPRRRRCARARH